MILPKPCHLRLGWHWPFKWNNDRLASANYKGRVGKRDLLYARNHIKSWQNHDFSYMDPICLADKKIFGCEHCWIHDATNLCSLVQSEQIVYEGNLNAGNRCNCNDIWKLCVLYRGRGLVIVVIWTCSIAQFCNTYTWDMLLLAIYFSPTSSSGYCWIRGGF